jgi:polar amino acid transport system substrate-binding protein
VLRFPLVAIGLLAASVAAAAATATAQAPHNPIFWAEKEQLAKPDISGRERIRFLTTTDFPPFNFLDAGGRLSGFHVDLARAICTALKVTERCQIQALPWAELEGALGRGEGEAIIAGVAVTPENRAKFAFTRPYLRFPARFVMPRSGLSDQPVDQVLEGKRVGVIAGSAHERMLRDYFPAMKPVVYSRAAWLFQDLKAGKLQAAFGDGMRLAAWLAEPDAAGCCGFAGGPYLAPEYLGHGLAIAVRADDPALAGAFDFALREVGMNGTFAELYLRYFPVGFF